MEKRVRNFVLIWSLVFATVIANWAAYPSSMVSSAQPPNEPIPIVTVDIAGVGRYGDHLIAAGWGTTVSLFTYFGGPTPLATINVEYPVDYVVLSEDNAYLLVVGNDRPFTETSQGHVSLYGPFATVPGPEPLLYHLTLDHSIFSGSSRPADIKRDGSFVAVGTGIADYVDHDIGMVYLIRTPAEYTERPEMWTHNYQDWIQSVRFSGDGNYLAVGATFNHSMALFYTPPLTLLWKTSHVADPYYATAPSYNADRIATGHGWEDRVQFIDGAGTLRWSSTQHGAQRQIATSDAYDYFAVAQHYSNAGDVVAFHLFEEGSNIPYWTYTPSTWSTVATSVVDASVSWNNRYIIGGHYQEIHIWGDGTVPPGVDVREDFDTFYGGIVNEVAMTYVNGLSVAGDSLGFLYVFNSVPDLQWWWLNTG